MTTAPILSIPVYQFPFPDDALALIGRITLMWGQIDVQVDQILQDLYRLGSDHLDHLFANKTLGPKADAVRVALDRCRDDETRTKMREMVESIVACIAERNTLTHGLWGWRWEPENGHWHACAWSRAKDRLFYARDLAAFHNKMVDASLKTDAAWYAQTLQVPPPENRNRKMLFSRVPPESLPGPPPDFVR